MCVLQANAVVPSETSSGRDQSFARRVLDCNKDELPNSLTDAEAKQCQKGDELYEVPRFISLNEGLSIMPATRDVVGEGH